MLKYCKKLRGGILEINDFIKTLLDMELDAQ